MRDNYKLQLRGFIYPLSNYLFRRIFMRKNGFTLIELLAVIVILAIIALIAVPIVLHIIEDSKKSSQEESIKMW